MARMDRDTEKHVRSCHGCQIVSQPSAPEPIVGKKLPDGLWEDLAVQHIHTTPLWPHANGEVERQKRTLLKAIRIAHAQGQDWRKELRTFLFAYRSTPHPTTGT